MQSKTSFFNQTVFWSDQRHFWPLTAGYAMFWFLMLPFSRLSEYSYERALPDPSGIWRETLNIAANAGYWTAFFTAILFAMAMFSYLGNPRATGGAHALPARRETLFVTHYLAGLCAQLAAQLFTVALTMVVLGSHGAFDLRLAALALLALALPTLFFYSFGVLCMIFTGQLLAAPVFYGVLNILVVGVEVLVRSFAGNFLYGWAENDTPALTVFSPIVKLVMNGVRGVRNDNGALTLYGIEWLLLYAAVGAALAALALLVYRTRRSEETGSTVAIPWARPIFKYGVSFCTALALGQLLYYLLFAQYRSGGDYSLAGTLACMAAAGLIGYFISEMLLKKSFRVFRSGAPGAAVMTAVLLALGVGMSFDLTGYEGYVPAAERVEEAYLYFTPYNSATDIRACLTEPGQLRLLSEAHRALVADKARQQSGQRDYDFGESDAQRVYGQFIVRYTLKDGRAVNRRYDVLLERAALGSAGSPEAAIAALYSEPRIALSRALVRYGYDSDRDPRTLSDLRFTGGYAEMPHRSAEGYYEYSSELDLTPEQARRVFEAVVRDAEAGRISDSYFVREPSFQGVINLYASYPDPRDHSDGRTYDDLTEDGRLAANFMPEVTERMSETIAALRSAGLIFDADSFA